MTAILSLGANLGERAATLDRALASLSAHGIRVERVSPIVESPAMLPADAPSEWNLPFLNLVAEVSTALSPPETLDALKAIEAELGRTESPRWSPRPIDIDLVLFDDVELDTGRLRIPHAGLLDRTFVLAPLAAIAPSRTIPGTRGRTVLDAYRQLGRPLPMWMGIVNVTPDSFSDGGLHLEWDAAEATIDAMTSAHAALIDVGAESTRPGASPLTPAQEWGRLAPFLDRLLDKYAGRLVRPSISVDTYHPEVAARALDRGVDVVNDVGGLTDPAMIELAAAGRGQWIAMHHVSLPADPSRTLSTGRSAVDQVAEWLDGRLEAWTGAGLATDTIVFDPGIGFGKTPLQSLELVRSIERFVRRDLRVLVGHSRKSFMRRIGGNSLAERDLLTIGASLELARRGVDILRVHNVPDHVTAWRGFDHAQSL